MGSQMIEVEIPEFPYGAIVSTVIGRRPKVLYCMAASSA
jgi:hypothetical protein